MCSGNVSSRYCCYCRISFRMRCVPPRIPCLFSLPLSRPEALDWLFCSPFLKLHSYHFFRKPPLTLPSPHWSHITTFFMSSQTLVLCLISPITLCCNFLFLCTSSPMLDHSFIQHNNILIKCQALFLICGLNFTEQTKISALMEFTLHSSEERQTSKSVNYTVR